MTSLNKLYQGKSMDRNQILDEIIYVSNLDNFENIVVYRSALTFTHIKHVVSLCHLWLDYSPLVRRSANPKAR